MGSKRILTSNQVHTKSRAKQLGNAWLTPTIGIAWEVKVWRPSATWTKQRHMSAYTRDYI